MQVRRTKKIEETSMQIAFFEKKGKSEQKIIELMIMYIYMMEKGITSIKGGSILSSEARVAIKSRMHNLYRHLPQSMQRGTASLLS